MKKRLSSIFTLCLLVSISFSLTIYAQKAEEDILKAIENQRFEAQVKKDFVVLEALLADDLIYTHSNGNTDTKASYIQSIREGKSVYESITPEEMKVRFYGKIAIINGICSIKLPTASLHLKYIDVYVKRNGKWQMIAWQSLKLAQ